MAVKERVTRAETREEEAFLAEVLRSEVDKIQKFFACDSEAILGI